MLGATGGPHKAGDTSRRRNAPLLPFPTAATAGVLHPWRPGQMTLKVGDSLDFLEVQLMMKQSIFLATCALACSAALAQAPVSPASPNSPAATEAMPPAGAGMKPGADMPMGAGGPGKGMKPGADMPMGTGGPGKGMGMGMGMGHMGMDMKAMDTNGDGMISKKEFDSHHQAMWKKMKSKNGMVPIAEVEALMQGGRN